MSPAAIRIKSHWFRTGTPKTPEQQAGAMGFTIWRVAQQTLKRMRGADFDIDAGEPYFGFMREMLVFLIVVADRLAQARFDGVRRVAFTTELVLHVAATLQDNELDLLGTPAPGQPRPRDRFIDLFNEVSDQYAEYGGQPGAAEFTPDFGFLRCLGYRIEPTLPAKDQQWVLDQVMAVEAPDAVVLVQRTLRELHASERRPARRGALSGD